MYQMTEEDMLKEQARLAAQQQAPASPAQAPAQAPNSLLTMPERPVSPYEQLKDEHGNGGAIMRLLGTGLSGGLLGGALVPQLQRGNQMQYASDLESYNTDMADYKEQKKFKGYFDLVNNGVEDEGDAFARTMLAKQYGIKELDYGLNGGVSTPEPKWVVKYDNGTAVRVDENGHYPTEVLRDPDGGLITEKQDADTRKTEGWFTRAVPALENMHKLEDRGVTLPRSVLKILEQSQDSNGMLKPLFYQELLNNEGLSSDQRQYLRNAQDLAMIQLRKESGAAIGVAEMFNELSQNIMLDDMSDEGYLYQRGQARMNKYRGLASGLPDHVTKRLTKEGYFETLDGLRKNSARHYDTSGERTDFSKVSDEKFEELLPQLPPGIYKDPDGDDFEWKGLPKSNVFGSKK